MATGAELTYTTNVNAMAMANAMFGNGVTVVNASMNVPNNSTAKGLYTNGQLAPGVVPGNTGVILSTGDIRNFTQSNGDPNRNTNTSGDTNGTDNNAQFNALAGGTTYDAVWLDATFIPTGNLMTMKFVFSSEEYPEYIHQNFNDVVGVWVNGQHVPITIGDGEISVDNINEGSQQNLVRSNLNDDYNTEMDGFTITLSLVMRVNPNVQNTIRIGIADAGDNQWDSAVLIPTDSIQTVLVAEADEGTVRVGGVGQTFDVLNNDVGGTLHITHINGVPVVAGQTVTLPSGQQVRLNADGTLTVVASNAGATEKVFTYQVQDTAGNTAVGLVTINQIACFVEGTAIRTTRGDVPVEALKAGDMVLTLDDGAQPLRWIGTRKVAAIGPLAPVHIAAGTFGRHGALAVSPQHRVLVNDCRAELLFGESEVLVAAKDMVNGTTIRQVAGGEVTYVHLLFDRHQVVWSEGLTTESFLPGPQTAGSLDGRVMDEVRMLFPALNPQTGEGYGPAARRVLRRHEAQVLFGGAPEMEAAEAA